MEKKNKSGFRVVPDTNIILSSELSANRKSPNREFIERWLNGEFALLFSYDTKVEYAVKLNEKGIPRKSIVEFLANLAMLGDIVSIDNYHLEYYPADEDDICFVLCAENGDASHIISYDKHILELKGKFKFKVLKVLPFLQELRKAL